MAAFNRGGEAAAGEDLQVLGGLPDEAKRARVVHDGVGEGMVGSLLGGGGDAEQVAFRVAGEGVHGCEHRAAHGEGPGFVEDDGVEMGEAFESFTAFEEDSELRTAADGDGEGTAIPMAQGQATTRTATVLARASGSE